MKFLVKLLLTLVCLLTIFTNTYSKTFISDELKIEVNIPDKFETQIKNNSLIINLSENCMLIFNTTNDKNLESHLQSVENEILKNFNGLILESNSTTLLNNINYVVEDYKTNDDNVKISILFTNISNDQNLIIYFIRTFEDDIKFQDEVINILTSIKLLDKNQPSN